jgi:hypothetical protein
VLLAPGTPQSQLSCPERRHKAVKKAQTEQEIHARLRELADDARRLREELARGTSQRMGSNAFADERQIRSTKPRQRNKKR